MRPIEKLIVALLIIIPIGTAGYQLFLSYQDVVKVASIEGAREVTLIASSNPRPAFNGTNPTIRVKAGETLLIRLVNLDDKEHDLIIPALNIRSDTLRARGIATS